MVEGVIEGEINNDQFVQVQTPHKASKTTFAPTPVMQFYINQSKVPSIVAFRMRILQNGYYIRSFDVLLSK
jgi:hypothetical protein